MKIMGMNPLQVRNYSSLEHTWFEVARLFPGKTGYKILEAILASAEIIQQTLPVCGLVDVAVLNCHNLAVFAKQLGCGKDTLLRYVKVYRALGMLSHSRLSNRTVLSLPLIPYLPSSKALQGIKLLLKGGRKKQQELAQYVCNRYVLTYGLTILSDQETQDEGNSLLSLLDRISQLLQKKRIGRIERQVLSCEIATVMRQMTYHQRRDLATTSTTVQIKTPQQGDFSAQQPEEVQQQGDLFPVFAPQDEDCSHEKGDFIPKLGDLLHTREVVRAERMQQLGDQVSCQGDFSAQQPEEVQQQGDRQVSDKTLSSIESIHSNKISSQKELEFESKNGEPWSGNEDELSQEAVRYLRLLDGLEHATTDYLHTNAGKEALGGYKNKIRQSPRLARIAAINALLQQTFYDLTRQKKPLENAGGWFHSSFKRYADQVRPLEITGEILDWAKSPYTLEEIATVIPLERKRQETQWWSSERLHLPLASCVALHQYLQDTVSEPATCIQNQQHDLLLLETVGQNAKSQWMNYTEAEQLVDEIHSKASWYLDEIHVHPAPQFGEQVCVVVAFIADSTFPVSYASRQDWLLEHQHQVSHQEKFKQTGDVERIYA